MDYPKETDNLKEATSYNGWKNYETWNVALWLDNDYFNYSILMMQSVKTYQDFLDRLQSPNRIFNNLDVDYDYRNFTGDNVSWIDPKVDVDEINEKIKELKA